MTNWQSPVVQQGDQSSFFPPKSKNRSGLTLHHRRFHQTAPFRSWPVHVGHPFFSFFDAWFLSHQTRWEFVLNLHFDYSVIMRKRQFIWTQLVYSLPASMRRLRPKVLMLWAISSTWDVVGALYSTLSCCLCILMQHSESIVRYGASAFIFQTGKGDWANSRFI